MCGRRCGIALVLLFFTACLGWGGSALSEQETHGLRLYYTGNTWGYLDPCPS